MSNSSLVDYVKISPNSNPRKSKIDKITIHHMAGNLSVETCGNIFANGKRKASSNYGIGSDGRLGMYVEENRRAWTSSNADNDHRAVTIEVANDGAANTNWHVSDKALAKLIDLCVDICKRNGITKLNYTGDTSGNLTRHNMFIATTCPGTYLQNKFSYIADEVNKRLNETNEDDSKNDKPIEMAPTPESMPQPEPKPQADILDLVKKTIRGDFGNGETRKKNLGSNYEEVQRQVNLNLKNGLTQWNKIKLF